MTLAYPDTNLTNRSTMLEVCVDSIESALAAVKGGAGRIELCSALSEGGLTPSPGILKTLKRDLNIKTPVFCMLRPRRGNDFQYSSAEIQSLLYDMEILLDAGTDGFVFGALDAKQNVHIEQCKTILKATKGLPVTFHRAFDMMPLDKMHYNCDTVASLGFKRLLTSGLMPTAEEGLANLKKLVEKHRNICIMPGSGVNPRNLEKIISETGCKEFHASARIRKGWTLSDDGSSSLAMGGTKEDAEPLYVASEEIVKELVRIGRDAVL